MYGSCNDDWLCWWIIWCNGKTLTVGLNTGFNGIFSPLYYQTVYDDYVIEMVYQSMLSYDRDNQLQPQLATEQPTISEDGSTLTFKLKKE